ncbi:MAG TPA: nuclear transport factor 2 family protein [Burkholderiaceae bacterium]|nr:nuclear transport factor 2 family protein [Burkholderiaceae bacterium]
MVRPKPLTAALMASPDDVEAQLYEAMQAGDIDKLMATWADDDDIACVHVGGVRLVGAGPIRASFEAMFANGSIDVRPVQVRCADGNGFSIHHVVEQVRVAGEAEGEAQTVLVLVTNVYAKTPQGWRLLLHHASPASKGEVQEVVESPSTLH